MAGQNGFLAVGDVLAMAIVTVAGFATHAEAGLSFLPRMLIVFIPLTIAWFLLAPWYALFRKETTSSPKQLWRPAFVMFFAAPFAVILRGLILNAPIIPIFAVVLCAASALGMLVWRSAYFCFTRKS